MNFSGLYMWISHEPVSEQDTAAAVFLFGGVDRLGFEEDRCARPE